MFSVVFSSANQQLIIFNHTGIAVLLLQRCDRGMEQECVAAYAAGGVSTARRGWEGRETQYPCGDTWALSPDPQALAWAPTRRADPALVLHFGSPCCSTVGLNGECDPEGRTGLWCHQEGGSWPSLSHCILTSLWRLHIWCCAHRDAQILLHGCKKITHLLKGQSRKKDLVLLGLLPISLWWAACFRVWAPLVRPEADPAPKWLNGANPGEAMAALGLAPGSSPVQGASFLLCAMQGTSVPLQEQSQHPWAHQS